MPIYKYLLYPLIKFMERNPKRMISNISNAVLSPADGRIVYVRPIEKSFMITKDGEKVSIDDLLKGRHFETKYGYAIAVYMSPLDVHINRSPVDGVVEKIYHKNGAFFRTSKKPSEMNNERNCIIIKNDRLTVAVIQIAAKFFGKIICNLKEGQSIRRGDVIGMITLGSQVDVLVSKAKSLRPSVERGRKVYAGVSPICSF